MNKKSVASKEHIEELLLQNKRMQLWAREAGDYRGESLLVQEAEEHVDTLRRIKAKENLEKGSVHEFIGKIQYDNGEWVILGEDESANIWDIYKRLDGKKVRISVEVLEDK